MIDQQHSPRYLHKAFLLLAELRNAHCGARLSELATRTGLAKTTTHRLLGVLVGIGLVTRTGNVYRPVATCRHWNCGVDAEQRTLLNSLAPFSGDLMARTCLTASLAVLHGTDVVFAHTVHGHQDVRNSGENPGREPAHRSAAGRLLLAYDSQKFRNLTEIWAADAEEEVRLARELLAIRRDHYAVDIVENDVTSVAVPLHGRPGIPNVAFTLNGRINRAELDILLGHMRSVVWRAGNKLRGIPGPTTGMRVAS